MKKFVASSFDVNYQRNVFGVINNTHLTTITTTTIIHPNCKVEARVLYFVVI